MIIRFLLFLIFFTCGAVIFFILWRRRNQRLFKQNLSPVEMHPSIRRCIDPPLSLNMAVTTGDLETLAARGDKGAARKLSAMYDENNPETYALAFKWTYHLAVVLKDKQALDVLAKMYAHGHGVAKDEQAARLIETSPKTMLLQNVRLPSRVQEFHPEQIEDFSDEFTKDLTWDIIRDNDL